MSRSSLAAPLCLILMAAPMSAQDSADEEIRVLVQGGELVGVLTRPNDPIAAVVLLSGGGASDRDYAAPSGLRTFRALAAAFALESIATLRFDDRGAGATSAPIASPADPVDDLARIGAWIRERDDLRGIEPFVLGHSIGGMVAVAAAAGWPELAGLLLLSSPALPGPEALVSQRRQVLRLQGVTDPALSEQMELFNLTLRATQRGTGWEEIETLSDALLGDGAPGYLAEHRNPMFQWMAHFEPNSLLVDSDVPLLYVFGEADVLVAASDHRSAAETLVRGRPSSSVVVVPHMNHALQTSALPGPAGWSEGGDDFAEGLVDELVKWLREVVTSR